MRRLSWLALSGVEGLLLLTGCGNDAAPEQVRRGHEIFGPAARELAAGLLAETKARDPRAAAQLVATAGNEAAFLDHSSREILVRYGVVLALTDTQAADLRAGRFDDPGNRKRVEETVVAFGRNGLPLPEACRYALDRVRAGEWTGLKLDFSARILWSEAMRPR